MRNQAVEIHCNLLLCSCETHLEYWLSAYMWEHTWSQPHSSLTCQVRTCIMMLTSSLMCRPRCR